MRKVRSLQIPEKPSYNSEAELMRTYLKQKKVPRRSYPCPRGEGLRYPGKVAFYYAVATPYQFDINQIACHPSFCLNIDKCRKEAE